MGPVQKICIVCLQEIPVAIKGYVQCKRGDILEGIDRFDPPFVIKAQRVLYSINYDLLLPNRAVGSFMKGVGHQKPKTAIKEAISLDCLSRLRF